MELKNNKSGFKTPPGYFEALEDRLVTAVKAEVIPIKSGFDVPDGYFDQLDDKVLMNVSELQSSGKVISLLAKKQWAYVAAIAACAILLFSIIKTGGPQDFEDLDMAAIESYIDEGSLDIDTDDVLILFDDESIDNLSFSTTNLDQDNLREYLLENMDDSSFLNE